MPTVTRLTNTGTLMVNGTFDEINGPIVTNGLRLWLEAANPNSYSGTGTAWNDLSGNGNNGTLNNGVGFDSVNGGLVFDGSDDYVDLNTNNIITGTNPFTFSCFYTITAFNGGGEIFGNYGTGYTTNYLWISGEYGAYLDGSVYFPGAPLSAGTYHIAVTRDSAGLVILYKNGVQVNSGTLASSIAVGPNFRLGADTNIPGERLNGKIYNQLVYNRALTADEITQNYNARRQLFNLDATSSTTVVGKISMNTNTVFASVFDEFTGAPVVDSSLQLWLDAGQTTSYSGSGTTWTDLSGSGNNGTLVNGVTFDAIDGGGCFSLDGSNDHISCGTTGVAASTVTIEIWVKKKGNNGHFFIIDNSDQPEIRFQFISTGLEIRFYDNGAYFTDTVYNPVGGFDTNLWYHIVATLENGSQKYYVNGSLVVSTSGTYDGSPTTNAGEHTLGTYNRPGAGYNGYANVKYAVHKIYNRALTAAEVVQNYNALQSRYGLVSITSTQMPVVQRQQSSGTLLVNGEFDEMSMTTGGTAYVTTGTFTWTAPADITSVNVLAIGGGAAGSVSNFSGGGGGGGLGWKNNIAVTPGNSYTVVVGSRGLAGAAGGDSYFISTSTVFGGGGKPQTAGTFPASNQALGGSWFGNGGGNGGLGGFYSSSFTGYVAAGGGAGGYSGNGGAGGNNNTGVGGNGSGGGGGGGGTQLGVVVNTRGGGGTGIYGQGLEGVGGTTTPTVGGGGSGGSNGSGQVGGNYGAGGANAGSGANGAVRIIWGSSRTFPSTGDLTAFNETTI